MVPSVRADIPLQIILEGLQQHDARGVLVSESPGTVLVDSFPIIEKLPSHLVEESNRTVPDDFVTDMYELNQPKGGEDTPRDLGPLPTGSKVLLGSLLAVWVILGAYAIAGRAKKKG